MHSRRNKNGYDLIFCNSMAGLEEAVRRKNDRTCQIKTNAPCLIHSGYAGVIDACGSIDYEKRRKFKSSIKGFGTTVHNFFKRHEHLSDYRRTAARAAVMFSPKIFDAMTFSREDLKKKILLIETDTGQEKIDLYLRSNLEQILSGVCNFDVCKVQASFNDAIETDASRFLRWYYRGISYITYRFGLLLGTFLSQFKRENWTVYIVKENELLQETAASLFQYGASLRKFSFTYDKFGFKQSAGKTLDPVMLSSDRERLISIYEKYLTQFVTKELVSSLAAKAVDHIDEHLIRQRDTTISLLPRISKVPSNSIFLTNYPGTPEANALARTAMRYGLPTIAFQHGVSREINGDHGDMGVENSSANLTFVYNQTAKLKSDETAYCHGKTEPTSFPGKGQKLSKKLRIFAFKTNKILYLSTNVYRGNIASLISPRTDFENYLSESTIIHEVLGKLPHPVSYKPYPFQVRYADQDPIICDLKLFNNIELLKSNIDARYFMRSPSVIVTSRATSTTGWAIMSGKPLCFIDIPDQQPLHASLIDHFSDAFFYFRLQTKKDTEALRTFLSLPINEIENMWLQKKIHRESFISQHISSRNISGGELAAEFLIKEYKNLTKPPYSNWI